MDADPTEEAVPDAKPTPVATKGKSKGPRLWRRLSTSLGRVSSQPVAMPASDTASEATERTRSAASLGAVQREDPKPEEHGRQPEVLEDHEDGLALEAKPLEIRSADSSMPGSLYHSTTTSHTRLSSLVEAGADAGAEVEATEADGEDRRVESARVGTCTVGASRRGGGRSGAGRRRPGRLSNRTPLMQHDKLPP